jgi:hypothetical protein
VINTTRTTATATKITSLRRFQKSSRENKNNRDVSDISIILAALDNEFWRRGLVIDSGTTSVIARTKKRLCTKPIKGWNTHQETDKNKMCVDVERKKTAGKSRKGGKPDKKSVERRSGRRRCRV